MSEARARLVYEVVRRTGHGQGVRAIARQMGIARKTVRAILREHAARKDQGDDALARSLPRSRAPRSSKLDAFDADIRELVARYPDIRATRLHEELVERGFDGGYTIVRERLEAVRPKPSAARPFQVVRTAAGVQGQVDWSPYKLEDGTAIYALSCVLSFSRFQYVHFTTDMRQPTLFRELRKAFEHHGGIAEQYVFDSMPGIVDRWELGEPVLNARAVDFAAYHGFEIHVAPRADGPYKGKVERPFRYLEESFFNARTLCTLAGANEVLAWWLEHRANVRTHTITRRRPAELLDEERPALTALPLHPYDDREIAYRLVDEYGYVHFDGNRYLATAAKVGSWVYLRAGEHEVEILGPSVQRLASHPRAGRGEGRWVPEPEVDRTPARRRIGELLERYAALGQVAERYALALKERKRFASVELARILALQETYSADDLLKALEHAGRYAAYGSDAVERVLRAHATPRTLSDRMAQSAREQIRAALAGSPVRQRGLAEYSRLLSGSFPTKGAQEDRAHDTTETHASPDLEPEDPSSGRGRTEPQ